MDTLLIGAGNIAGAKETAKKSGPTITHIQAIMNRSDLNLVGIIDSKPGAGINLAMRWGLDNCLCWESLTSMNDSMLWDMMSIKFVIIATPPETHLGIIKDVFRYLKPEIILLEKPGGDGLDEAIEIGNLCISNECHLYINYQRNYSVDIDYVKQHVGKIRSATCHYVRGLKNDASHGIALLQEIVGSFHSPRTNACVSDIVIRDKTGDSTVHAMLSFPDDVCVFLHGHDGREYDMFEIELFGSNGHIKLIEHGSKLVARGIVCEQVYGKYQRIENCFRKMKEFDISLDIVYDKIIKDAKTSDPVTNKNEFVDYIGTWIIMHQVMNARKV